MTNEKTHKKKIVQKEITYSYSWQKYEDRCMNRPSQQTHNMMRDSSPAKTLQPEIIIYMKTKQNYKSRDGMVKCLLDIVMSSKNIVQLTQELYIETETERNITLE